MKMNFDNFFCEILKLTVMLTTVMSILPGFVHYVSLTEVKIYQCIEIGDDTCFVTNMNTTNRTRIKFVTEHPFDMIRLFIGHSHIARIDDTFCGDLVNLKYILVWNSTVDLINIESLDSCRVMTNLAVNNKTIIVDNLI